MKSRLRDSKPVAANAARRSKDAVVAATLAATYELLSESGLGGVSIDEVSRRSGVAKTTIYRHWATRSALLLDACSQLSPRPAAPDRGSLEADLTELAVVIARRLHAGRWSSVIPSVIDAAERDPEIAELHSRLHAGMMSAFQTVIAQARERGEIGAEQDPAEITASIAGPLFYRRWFSREPLGSEFVKGLVKRALSPPDRTAAAGRRLRTPSRDRSKKPPARS